MAVFSVSQQQAISSAIAGLERGSAAELVVAECQQCHTYSGERWAGCAGLLLINSVVALWLLPEPNATAVNLLCIQVLLAPFLWALSRSRLMLRLVPASTRGQRARERAAQLFVERGIHQTRGQTGVLVMFAELERQVVILGDRNIHAAVGDSGWQAYVDRLVTGLQSGAAAEVLIAVLHELSETMATSLPVEPDDRNELSNEVVVVP